MTTPRDYEPCPGSNCPPKETPEEIAQNRFHRGHCAVCGGQFGTRWGRVNRHANKAHVEKHSRVVS